MCRWEMRWLHGPGDHLSNVGKSSWTKFCTLKSILILNSNFEYFKPDITKTRQQDIVISVSW